MAAFLSLFFFLGGGGGGRLDIHIAEMYCYFFLVCGNIYGGVKDK